MEERYTLNTDSSLIRSITNNLTKKNESFIKISNEFTLENSMIEHRNTSNDSFKEGNSINTSLNLSRKSLKNAPVFNDLGEIEVLNLEGNLLSTIDSIPKKLTSINLRENKISFFPKALISAYHLEVLDLSHNRLINLDGIKNCARLKELYLAYNYISDEQLGVIESLKDLEVLDISHNHIKEEEAIKLVENLPKLRRFINNLNEYTEICFKKISNALEIVSIEENNLYVVEFQQSKFNLKTLALKNNRLAELIGIDHLPGLQNLHLENNKLKTLEIVKSLERLINLTAGGNSLQNIVLPARSSIENLDLSNNSLNAFEFLRNAVNVKYVNLSENRIDSFMGHACSLSNLIKLDLSKNKLKDVFNMDRFPNIQELNLSFNQISDTDSLIIELSKLSKLNSLDLRANRFNLAFDFDSVIPHGSVLQSLEALETILKPSSEDQFNKFIHYRGKFIQALSDTLTVLDKISITSYELSLGAFRSMPRSPIPAFLRTPISPTPTNDYTLNIGGPSLFDVNLTSSIDTAMSSAIFFSDKKKQQGTGLFNPMNMNSEFIEDDSLAYSKGTRSHNTTASKLNNNFTPPPKSEQYDSNQDPTSKSRSRYQSVYNSQNYNKPSNGQITPEEFFDEDTNRINKRPPMPVEERLKMKERQIMKPALLPVIPDELSEQQDSTAMEVRRIPSEPSRDDCRKVNDSKNTATFNNSFQSIKEPLQQVLVNQNDSLFEENPKERELNSSKHIKKLAEKFDVSRNLLNQMESRKSNNFDTNDLNGVSVHSDLSEIANELTKDYQKQLQVLKTKVKDKLKKIKENEDLIAQPELSINKMSPMHVQDLNIKRMSPMHNHDLNIQKISSIPNSEYNSRKMSPMAAMPVEVNFKNTNQIYHEIEKENRRPPSTKNATFQPNMLESTHGSRESHKSRKEQIPKPSTPTTLVANIMIPQDPDMENFFTEKVIERLESDERIARNPYYHLYKEMLARQNKLPERFSSNERSSERYSSRHSYSRNANSKEHNEPQRQKTVEKEAEKSREKEKEREKKGKKDKKSHSKSNEKKRKKEREQELERERELERQRAEEEERERERKEAEERVRAELEQIEQEKREQEQRDRIQREKLEKEQQQKAEQEKQKQKEKLQERKSTKANISLDPLIIEDPNQKENTTASFCTQTDEKFYSSKASYQSNTRGTKPSTPQRESIKVTQVVQTSPSLEKKYQSREVTPIRETVKSSMYGSENKDKSPGYSLKNSISAHVNSVEKQTQTKSQDDNLSVQNLEFDPKRRLAMSKGDSQGARSEFNVTHLHDELQPNDIAIRLFRERVPKNKDYLTSLNLINVFKDFLNNFKIDVSESVLEELFNEIEDFIPRKITEKSFVDLFHLPRIKEFLLDLGVPLNYQTARFAGISKHTEVEVLDIDYDIPEKSPQTNEKFSARGRDNSKSKKKHHREDSQRKSGSKFDHDNSIHSISMITNAESFIRPSENDIINPRHKRQSLDTTLNLSKLEEVHTSNKKQKFFRHSLTESDFKAMQKASPNDKQEQEQAVKLSLKDLIGTSAGSQYQQLTQYAITPPRPIFNKDVQPNLLKDVVACSPEFNLIASILGAENLELKRALKIYSYHQQKKISKIMEDKYLLSPLNSAHGIASLPQSKKTVNCDSLVTMKGNTMFFDDKILLIHTGKLNMLSQLVENPQGFKDVYKERPGDLIFSHSSHICMRTYKRFMKKLEKKGSQGFSDNSFLNNVAERPTWRLVISMVYLGSCYVENKMNFKEFAYFGELKVLELLRDGYTSIYFEKNDLYLVLIAENCTPVYLCEYQFDQPTD